MNAIILFLTSSPEVLAFAALILIAALWAFLGWYKPAVREVTNGVNRMNSALRQEPSTWLSARENVRSVLKSYPNLASSWMETEERVTMLSADGQSVMFGSPKDLWHASALLARRFNLGLAESVPNILVGVGLFFTFGFLSWALVETTVTLVQANSSAKDTENAISELLKVAGGKFLTSLAGLLASILWVYFSKVMLNKLNKACDDLLESLAKIVPNNGAEVLLNQQAQLLSQQVQMAKERQDLIEEMLTESREQTGTFKRFETDLAVSLAAAINQSVSPQMELMTTKLVGAIEGLSEKMGAMNEEALKTMLNDFAAMLKKATESEMNQLQQTLKELADRLQSVGGMLGEGGTKAGDAINEASALLVARAQEISENLSTGATDMQTAASAINTAMGELERAVTDAANVGQRGAVFVNDTLAKVNTTLERLDSVSGGLAETSQAMGSVSEKIANVVDNVEELSKEQRAVVLAVKEVAPTALAAVERVTGVLDQAASQTLSVMEQTKQSMESTAVTLNKTVVSITEGLTVYSNQVAELHQQMDGQLTKSVGSFETAASAINTAMGELEKTVADASNIGQRGAVFVNDTLEKLGATLERLDSVSGGLAEMSQAMESVGGKIANVVDNVEELSKEQRAVVLAVKEVAPTALAAVERVTGVLDQAASQTLNVMEQTKQSMESTAVTLTKTVASITEGVTVYSNQVAELHRQMDGQLAKAVGSFDRGVNELAESVEELADINDKVNQSLSDVDGNVVLLTQSVKNLTARIK